MSVWIIEVGDKVRVKETEVEAYIGEVSRKIKDRVGTIKSFTQPFDCQPVVVFPAEGRRKEFKKAFRESDLELVEKFASKDD